MIFNSFDKDSLILLSHKMYTYRVFSFYSNSFISQVEDSCSICCLFKTLQGLCYRHLNFLFSKIPIWIERKKFGIFNAINSIFLSHSNEELRAFKFSKKKIRNWVFLKFHSSCLEFQCSSYNYSSAWDKEIRFKVLKRGNFFLPITPIQSMCYENKFSNNSIKVMNITV